MSSLIDRKCFQKYRLAVVIAVNVFIDIVIDCWGLIKQLNCKNIKTGTK